MANINIKDVARVAGVSAMTVTRAIRTPELVKEDTRKKVQEVIDSLGYVPNYTASVLRSAKSKTIGIALYDIENPFNSKLIMALDNKLHEYNYNTLISFANEHSSDDYDVYTRLIRYNVDVLIFVPTIYNPILNNLSPEATSKCVQLFRNVYPNINSLIIDDAYGAYIATKYLIENGHKKIMLIDFYSHHSESSGGLDYDGGYKKAFKEKLMSVDEKYILKLDEMYSDDYVGIIAQEISDKKPTAILAVTQRLYSSVISATKKLNLSLYDDISLVGYDDSVLAEYLGITTIAHPFDRIINSLGEFVVNKLNNDNGSTLQKIVKPYLNIRNSVKKIN